MNKLFKCIKKDFIEFIREKKNIICFATLLCCAGMIMITTYFLPFILDKIVNVSNVFSDDMSIINFFNKFFPGDLKNNIGMFSSEVGVFYSMMFVILTYNLIPDEINCGKLIIPASNLIPKKVFVISKQITYGFLISLPVLAIYMSYYFIGNTFLQNNYLITDALINGLVLSFIIFIVTNITIVLSTIFSKKYYTIITMIGTVIFLPDILTYFEFGKYSPTYLLNFVYTSSNNFIELIIPIVGAMTILFILNIYAMKYSLSKNKYYQ